MSGGSLCRWAQSPLGRWTQTLRWPHLTGLLRLSWGDLETKCYIEQKCELAHSLGLEKPLMGHSLHSEDESNLEGLGWGWLGEE